MKKKPIICFDLDGTITAQEILPELSKEVGLYEEISALTEATIKGVIPFRQSFLLRCKLLQSIPLERVHKIINNIKLNHEIVDFINAHLSQCKVVTGNLDVWVVPLKKKIKCDFFTSVATEKNGYLDEIVKVLDKGDVVKSFSADKIISVGDGMGDVRMFEESDVRIAFSQVHNPIKSLIEVSDYICFNEKTLCKTLSTQLLVQQA